jgi:peptidoglycan/LPS O-acetylase OafA/YrhL
MRRALRLYPALLVVVVAATIVAIFEGIGRPAPDAFAATFYAFDFYEPLWPHLSPLAHTWSLGVEEQFYLVWPAILIALLAARRPLWPVVVGLATAGAVVAALLSAHDPAHIQQWPFAHLPELCAGILLALAVERQDGRRVVAAIARPGVAVVAMVVLVLGLFVVDGTNWLVFIAAAPICALPVAHLVTEDSSVFARSLGIRPVVWLGERSYGFYLWHYPVILVLLRHIDSRVGVAALGFVVSIGLTWVTWRYVEQPFLRRKARYASAAIPVGATPALSTDAQYRSAMTQARRVGGLPRSQV